MRNLDLINPAFAKPNRMCSAGAVIPFISGLCSLAFVAGASGSTGIRENNFFISLCAFSFLSFCLFFIPRIFKWDWSGKYFFIGALELGCMGLFGIVSWLCFLFYSPLPLVIKIPIFLAQLIFSCSLSYKFFQKYSEVKKSPKLKDFLYQVEGGIVYYLQNNDVFLIEKKFRLSFFPNTSCFLVFSIIAFGLFPFARDATVMIGLPFPHIFLAIFSIPINMMALAFVMRAWMVFFYLPKNLEFGKRGVYVDMSTRTKLKK